MKTCDTSLLLTCHHCPVVVLLFVWILASSGMAIVLPTKRWKNQVNFPKNWVDLFWVNDEQSSRWPHSSPSTCHFRTCKKGDWSQLIDMGHSHSHSLSFLSDVGLFDFKEITSKAQHQQNLPVEQRWLAVSSHCPASEQLMMLGVVQTDQSFQSKQS